MRGRGGAEPIAKDVERRSDLFALTAIVLLAMFVVHPLIVHGCSCGHDFDFHLVSWFEAATQIAHGNLHPHWAFTPAWDAGEPRFVFYPPLSWYLGAALGMLLTHLPRVSEAAAWAAAPILFTWIAITLSGMMMFRLGRRYASTSAALIAAAIYMANPYTLFTAYERTAYGELLAAAWMPLLLDGILRERITVPRVAISIALLWLTNAPAAVMGCYALALLAITRIMRGRLRGKNGSAAMLTDCGKIVGGVVLGFGIAAFYVVPAAHERRYVQAAMATVGGMRIDANFLFEHTGTSADDPLHDQVLRTASWIAVLLVVTTFLALFAAWLRRRKGGAERAAASLPALPLAILMAAIAFLLTPLSSPLWHHAPEVAYLQFPWRLLALGAPVCALAIGTALSNSVEHELDAWTGKVSARAMLAALVAAAALGLPAWHLFRQPCDPEDAAAARLALFHSNAGTDPTDEYTPVTADNDALAPRDPAWWLADTADAAAPARAAAGSTIRTAPDDLMINVQHAEFLILNLRDYAAWHVTMTHDGSAPQPVMERAHRPDGLIAISVPAGESTVDVRYIQGPDQTMGDAISCVSVVVLVGTTWRRKRAVPATRTT